MKGVTTWSHHPYRPISFDVGDIYVCRIAPFETGFTADWLPLDGVAEYTVGYRFYHSEAPFTTLTVKATTVTLDGLSPNRDYEFQVTAGEKKSRVRLARTGFVPGTSVVNYLHPLDKAYSYSGHSLCSPCIVRHPDGYLLASMDVFKGNAPQNLVLIYRSDDEGKTWQYVSDIFPCFWGRMFIHKGALYLTGCSNEYGDLLIGRSDDGGKTFGMPTVLLRGSCCNRQPGVHKNPQKVLYHKGRLWTTLEWGLWSPPYHGAMCASIDENDDLLDASKWSFTEPAYYSPDWEGGVGKCCGCIEGCMTVAPDGQLYNFLRYETTGGTPAYGKAVLMKPDVNDPEKRLEFAKVIDFPGNLSKFEVHFDEKSGLYFSIVSYVDDEHPIGRNLLSLIASKDMEHWELVTHIWDYRHEYYREVGFQYICFLMEETDVILTSRTAFNGAYNSHDANYNIFHRIKNFRDLIPDSLK